MLVLAGVALVVAATLTPGSPSYVGDALPQLCIICNRASAKDFLRNVLLFMPLGAGLRLGGASWSRTVVAAFALTAAVEVMQFYFVPRRDPSLRDLVANVLGGLAGWLAPYVMRHVAVSRRVVADARGNSGS